MSQLRDIEHVIDKLWEKAEPTLFIPKEEFVAALDGWTITPVHVDGELAFVFVSKGPHFHFESFGHHRITLKMIRDFLQPLIDAHGYAATSTPKDDERQHRFNKRFGFVATGEDEFDVHYRIERLPKCLS